MTEIRPYTLIASKGAGSVLAESALELSGLAYEIDEIPYDTPGPGRDRLLALNPLGQFPTLRLPDGAVMTESAAIFLHLADVAPKAGLAPGAADPARPAFLRWLVFISAAIYPTFVYGDVPNRWVSDEAAAAELRARTLEVRKGHWRQIESQIAPAPWFLGAPFSALDIYVGAMTQWRPGRAWFKSECPKLHAIGLAVDGYPKLAKVWARNFG